MTNETAMEPAAGLEARITETGRALDAAIHAMLHALPEASSGPQNLARALGLDKVLTSRLLKASRHRDPIAVIYHVPGPEPLRRFVRAARKRGLDPLLARRAERAIDDFATLIRREVGDRSALDALISAWLPEARAEFEMRRKQSAFRAMSQLKGASAQTNLATVLLHPSDDGEHIDIVWIAGLLGVRRLRPGATVKLSTRRFAEEPTRRGPVTLDGEPVEGMGGLRLDRFCHARPAALDVRHVGDTYQYLLGGDEYGPTSEVDLLMAEVNRAEMARYVPREKRRMGFVFAEVGTPTRALLFDVLVHEDVYPGAEPALFVYDTALDGVADVNDPARDVDRIDMAESLQTLSRGTASWRAPDVPSYVDLLRHVFDRVAWDESRFRGWRCRIEYPLYGSQVVAAFTPPEGP